MNMRRKLKRGFIGLRRDEVEQYLARLDAAHSAEVATLRAQVRLERERQEAIRQQLEWLEHKGIVAGILSQLQASRVQAEDAGSLLTELLRWDIVDIETLAAQEHEAISRDIAEVKAQLDEAVAAYKRTVAELEALAEASAATLPDGWDEIAATGPAADDAPAIQVPMAPEAVTPERAGMEDATGTLTSAGQEAALAVETEAEAEAARDADGEDPSGPAAAVPEPGAWPADAFNAADPDAPHDSAMAMDETAVPPAAAAVETGLMAYLQGKRLGQDLYTRTGELIAAAGSPLSIELIDRAEREGVLSDLVIDLDWQEADAQ